LEVNYHDEMISSEEVDTILDHFESALRFMIDHPNKLICDVELINDREMRQLVPKLHPVESSNAAQSVLELVEAQARLTPEKIAVCLFRPHFFLTVGAYCQPELQFTQSIFITYHQMDGFANDLARVLVAKGVKRGDIVALYTDKSVEMFISIFGTHKSGAGFVPLDPEHPSDRIRTILNLADSKIALVSRELEVQFKAAVHDLNITVLVVDINELTLATKPNVGPIGRNDICHVIFTSGSTGIPKGGESFL
jgi:non-ribosomal peptide synthetase component F